MEEYYKEKYLKYKSKYITAKQVTQTGGKRETWEQKEKKRRKELVHMKTTRSYVSYDKIKNIATYAVHCNGGRPFVINVEPGEITILTGDTTYKKIKQIKNFEGYWTGYDASVYKFHGNTILIRINKYKYIYVGCEIFSFKTKEEILDFISPMGNSDVPYPLAYGTENIYFLCERSYVKSDQLHLEPTVINAEELYGEFYGHITFPETQKFDKVPLLSFKRLVARE
jgi:hypothetical protein